MAPESPKKTETETTEASESVEDVSAAIQEKLALHPTVDLDEGDGDDDDEDDDEEEEDDEPTILSYNVTKRVMHLRKLQEERNQLEAAYRDERIALEKKYNELYTPLYVKRHDIVTGTVEAPDDTDMPERTDEDAEDDEVGVPGFWLRALATNETVAEMIEEKDLEVLNFLQDVKCVDHDDMTGFTLEFHFKANPFFSNALLTKRYDVPNLLHGDEPMLEDVKGTEIEWATGKNLCVRLVKKKQHKKGGGATRTITKREACDSFFNFFSAMELPGDEEMDEDAEEALVEKIDQDFVRGMVIRERIIPYAILWFTGEATDGMDDDEEDDEDDEEDGDEDEDSDEGGPATQQAGDGSAADGEKPDECKQQ